MFQIKPIQVNNNIRALPSKKDNRTYNAKALDNLITIAGNSRNLSLMLNVPTSAIMEWRNGGAIPSYAVSGIIEHQDFAHLTYGDLRR